MGLPLNNDTVTMISLFKSLTHLFAMSPSTPQDRDARYLSQATDLYDLERRMRQIDSGRNERHVIDDYGMFMR